MIHLDITYLQILGEYNDIYLIFKVFTYQCEQISFHLLPLK